MTTKSRTHTNDEVPHDKVEEAAEKIGRYARKFLENSTPLGGHADDVIVAIREEPVKATLIALALGLTLGLIIRR